MTFQPTPQSPARTLLRALTRGATYAPIAAPLLTILLALAVTGCSFKSEVEESSRFFKKIFSEDTYSMYRIDVQQGNTLDLAKLSRLKLGMTKEQVRYLIGNPVTDNVFHKNRWNYVYYLIPGEGKVKKYRLVLLFDDELLHNIHKSRRLVELEESPPRPKTDPEVDSETDSETNSEIGPEIEKKDETG